MAQAKNSGPASPTGGILDGDDSLSVWLMLYVLHCLYNQCAYVSLHQNNDNFRTKPFWGTLSVRVLPYCDYTMRPAPPFFQQRCSFLLINKSLVKL